MVTPASLLTFVVASMLDVSSWLGNDTLLTLFTVLNILDLLYHKDLTYTSFLGKFFTSIGLLLLALVSFEFMTVLRDCFTSSSFWWALPFNRDRCVECDPGLRFIVDSPFYALLIRATDILSKYEMTRGVVLIVWAVIVYPLYLLYNYLSN